MLVRKAKLISSYPGTNVWFTIDCSLAEARAYLESAADDIRQVGSHEHAETERHEIKTRMNIALSLAESVIPIPCGNCTIGRKFDQVQSSIKVGCIANVTILARCWPPTPLIVIWNSHYADEVLQRGDWFWSRRVWFKAKSWGVWFERKSWFSPGAGKDASGALTESFVSLNFIFFWLVLFHTLWLIVSIVHDWQ